MLAQQVWAAEPQLQTDWRSMAREPIINPEPPDDDSDHGLRPERMDDMIGQRDVIERLKISIAAAKKRGEQLAHILFDGPPGLGKTTFATVIPRELDVPVHLASGPMLKAPKDLVPYLTNLQQRAVLFIDEIHRMPRGVEEYLYTAMEDFRIDLVLGEGVNARTHNLPLKPFTLIGATTRAGMLTGPLRDRFPIREHLSFYDLPEMTRIVQRSAAKLKIKTDDDAAEEIARRSRSTPRIANTRLLWVRDFAETKAQGKITMQVAQDALRMLGVDKLGLDKQDRQYLTTLIRVFDGGPAGVEAVAHTMNASADTLSDEVEPYLLRIQLVVRTPRGRVATANAFQHLQLDGSPGDSQKSLFN